MSEAGEHPRAHTNEVPGFKSMTSSSHSEYQRLVSESSQAWLTPCRTLPLAGYLGVRLAARVRAGRWWDSTTFVIYLSPCHVNIWKSRASQYTRMPQLALTSMPGVILWWKVCRCSLQHNVKPYQASREGKVAVTATKWVRELCTLLGLLQIKSAANSNKSQLCKEATFTLWWKPFSLVLLFYMSSSLLGVVYRACYTIDSHAGLSREVFLHFGNLQNPRCVYHSASMNIRGNSNAYQSYMPIYSNGRPELHWGVGCIHTAACLVQQAGLTCEKQRGESPP